jgi:hypothetical protein
MVKLIVLGIWDTLLPELSTIYQLLPVALCFILSPLKAPGGGLLLPVRVAIFTSTIIEDTSLIDGLVCAGKILLANALAGIKTLTAENKKTRIPKK